MKAMHQCSYIVTELSLQTGELSVATMSIKYCCYSITIVTIIAKCWYYGTCKCYVISTVTCYALTTELWLPETFVSLHY